MRAIKNYCCLILAVWATMALPYANAKAVKYKSEKRITIRAFIKSTESIDTLVLYLSNKFYPNQENANNQKFIAKKNKQGAFVFDLPVNQTSGYWEIRKLARQTKFAASTRAITLAFFWHVGDNVTVIINHTSKLIGVNSIYKFRGVGAAKYTAKAKADSVFNIQKKGTYSLEQYGVYPEEPIKLGLLEIEKYKKQLSVLDYEVLKHDIVFQQPKMFLTQIGLFIKANDSLLTERKRAFIRNICKWQANGRDLVKINPVYTAQSNNAIRFIVNALEAESFVLFNKITPKWVYNTIKERYTGPLRDNLIVYSLINAKKDKTVDNIYSNALTIIKSTEAVAELKNLQHLFSARKFPDYILKDTLGNDVSLASLKNKVLVVDFWFTGCLNCELYYKNTISKVKPKFHNDSSVQFVSISTDRIMGRWKKSVSSGDYTSPDALNLYTNGKGIEHPITRENAIRAFPTAILIDKNGNLQYFNTENLYSVDSLINTIEDFKSKEKEWSE